MKKLILLLIAVLAIIILIGFKNRDRVSINNKDLLEVQIHSQRTR